MIFSCYTVSQHEARNDAQTSSALLQRIPQVSLLEVLLVIR
jgi:hypothetical protein